MTRISNGVGSRAYSYARDHGHTVSYPGGLFVEEYDPDTGVVTDSSAFYIEPWYSGAEPFFSDIDGDGSDEILGLAETSLVIVSQEEPSILSAEEVSLPLGSRIRERATVHYGDFDADGYVDILTMRQLAPDLAPTVRWGSPAGLSEASKVSLAVTNFVLSGGFETRDVDGELGRQEVLIRANYQGMQGVVVLQASSDRTFSFRFEPDTELGQTSVSTVLGDIDGDGLIDRVSSLENETDILLVQRGIRSDDEMVFDEGVYYRRDFDFGGIDNTVYLGSQLGLADVTGDGVLDVLFTTNNHRIAVLPGISSYKPGDVNRDEAVDATDISLLMANQDANVNSSYRLDLTGDQLVNQNDVDHWLEHLVETRRGDLDLDGDVDFADFLALSANFGQSDAVWSDGDLDGDGTVAFADFLILSSNFGFDRALAKDE